MFSKLYEIEKVSRENEDSVQERLERRQRDSLPVFEALKLKVLQAKNGFLPKSPAGMAAQYFLKHETGLRVFLTDRSIPIDNNPAERTVKPFVMARKNFLFSNTSRGARATAICFTIAQTAVLNGLRPEAYLTYVLDQFRKVGLRDEVVRDLLPYSDKLPDELYVNGIKPKQKKS
nr:transposase [Allobaculum mucilyticum]